MLHIEHPAIFQLVQLRMEQCCSASPGMPEEGACSLHVFLPTIAHWLQECSVQILLALPTVWVGARWGRKLLALAGEAGDAACFLGDVSFDGESGQAARSKALSASPDSAEPSLDGGLSLSSRERVPGVWIWSLRPMFFIFLLALARRG